MRCVALGDTSSMTRSMTEPGWQRRDCKRWRAQNFREVYLSLSVNGRTLYPDATVHSGGALSAQLTERGDQGAEGSESKADCFTRESVRR
jgi:hypothetical protein